ncbi:hypothetical protein RMSM_01750, partial [Rhodopirellula maiorica SM1]
MICYGSHKRGWNGALFLLALVQLLFVGCNGDVTIPLPTPKLELSVDEKLPAQVLSSSQGLTVDGSLTLVPGTYKYGDVLVVVQDHTDVTLSDIRLDFERIDAETIKVIPSKFAIAFSETVDVDGVQLAMLDGDASSTKVQVDVYGTLKNLIALAVVEAVVVPQESSVEEMVSKVVLNSARVEMRPKSSIRLGGLDMKLLAGEQAVGTSVHLGRTTATFDRHQDGIDGEGSIKLNLSCSIEGSHDEQTEVVGKTVMVMGAAAWTVKTGVFSAETEEPLSITLERLDVKSEQLNFVLTPSDESKRLTLKADGNWATDTYAVALRMSGVTVEGSSVVDGGKVTLRGILDESLAVCKHGKLHSVKTEKPARNVTVNYSKKLDDARVLEIKSELPKINVSLDSKNDSLGISFADVVAQATQILVKEKGSPSVTMVCGSSRLLATGAKFSGGIDAIKISLDSGAIAEFSDVVVEELSDEGTGSVSCVLQDSALPTVMRKELGDTSLTTKTVRIMLKGWKPLSIDMHEFTASADLQALQKIAREAIEKKHSVDSKDKFVPIKSADVKLTSFKLSPAQNGTHVHLTGTVRIDGKVRVKSDDVL